MTRADIFGSDIQWIENWVQRIESVSSLDCINIRDVWNKQNFTKNELKEAYKRDCAWFRGYADTIMSLCPTNYAFDELR